MAESTYRLLLGLISGTSADAIDAALLHRAPVPRVLAARSYPYEATLRSRILDVMHAEQVALDELGRLDRAIGEAFAQAASSLLQECGLNAAAIDAIGSHGQTVRHRPDGPEAFTLQLGDPNVIAERTGCRVVADFRRRDLAAGGQGAPLVPAFHAALWQPEAGQVVVLNLGGIANLSILEAGRPPLGFDVGPANCLMDAHALHRLGQPFDRNGDWARRGRVDPAALERLLADPYFGRPPPKSTGREYFDLAWVTRRLAGIELAPVDLQATLLALTARSVAAAIRSAAPAARQVWLCGGGVHNGALISALAAALPEHRLASTAAVGIDPDFVEAAAFAWLAGRYLDRLPGNVPAVTGAHGPRVLGLATSGSAPEL